MDRRNCWEHKQCGREPGGRRSRELGVCPVAVTDELHGAHGGLNAGRACWVVEGSLCGGRVQGDYAKKLSECWRCDFFNAVKTNESASPDGFMTTRLSLQRYLERNRRN